VIDVGTNSVKLRVAERETDSAWRPVVDRSTVTRLGHGMHAGGSISADAASRTADVVGEMADEARRAGAPEVVAIGTAGLRTATNRDDVLAMIRERSGLTVEVISEDDEARLAYLAARSGLPATDGSVVVFDSGGGSSQFTFGDGDRVTHRFSVPVGSARYTDAFGLGRAVSVDLVAAALGAITADLSQLQGRRPPDLLVGMGGAATNMTAVMLELDPYDPSRVQGAMLPADEVERQIERYRSMDADGRRAIAGLQPDRAEVILAGACIVRVVMALLGATELTVSDRGVRHGVFLERFG
jgi:exopolyphosphatase/guanosine-5'-triphosphate,3'-diphosphate pyrophosphatase